MTLEDEYRLSLYKELAEINEVHQVRLVQNIESKRIYVLKRKPSYSLPVYLQLKAHPVPGTPEIIEVIEDGETLIVIEEYINGVTLQEHLSQSGCFSAEETVLIISSLCDTVTALHSLHPAVIHRDIKPENIILTPDYRVILLDFDAAKQAHPEKARDTVLLGTVGYASPEQYGFAPSGIQSDIYSVGILINVLLTGKMPQEKPADGRLGAVIRRCTQIDPENRYRSADELKKAVLNLSFPEKAHLPFYKFLPGFRGNNLWKQGVALFGYLLIFFIGITLEAEVENQLDLWLNRIFFLLLFYSEILFCGNFRNILSRLGISQTPKRAVRILKMLLGAVILMVLDVTCLLILESLI